MVSEFVYGAEDTDQIDAMLKGSFYKYKKSECLSKCVSAYDSHPDLQKKSEFLSKCVPAYDNHPDLQKKSEFLSKCGSAYDNHADLQTTVIHTKSSKNSPLHCNKKIPPGCIPR
jgi:hypothetical protein